MIVDHEESAMRKIWVVGTKTDSIEQSVVAKIVKVSAPYVWNSS